MAVIEWHERVQRMPQFSCEVLASRRRSALIFLYSVKDFLKDILIHGDYFRFIAFCSHSILLTNYAKHGPVGAS